MALIIATFPPSRTRPLIEQFTTIFLNLRETATSPEKKKKEK